MKEEGGNSSQDDLMSFILDAYYLRKFAVRLKNTFVLKFK